MHSHTILMIAALLVSFTAGFIICELNLEDLQQLYRSVKQRVYKS